MAVSSNNLGFACALVVVVVGTVVVVEGGVVVVEGGVVVVLGGVVVVVVAGWAVAVPTESALAKITAEIEVPIPTKPRRTPTPTILVAYRPNVKYPLVRPDWAGATSSTEATKSTNFCRYPRSSALASMKMRQREHATGALQSGCPPLGKG
jgi:hypothetical protein